MRPSRDQADGSCLQHMQTLRLSSLEEYAAWYLAREATKPASPPSGETGPAAVVRMWQQHQGKMRDWFRGDVKWSIVTLDNLPELEHLIFLESTWTTTEGLVVPNGTLNYRLLGRVAENAARSRYLDSERASAHRKYLDDLCSGRLRLAGDSRIALCSSEDNERRGNPAGTFYLLDGVGRCLPLVMLLQARDVAFEPIEAFLAERMSNRHAG